MSIKQAAIRLQAVALDVGFNCFESKAYPLSFTILKARMTLNKTIYADIKPAKGLPP